MEFVAPYLDGELVIQLLIRTLLRDLVQVSTDNYIRLPIETACDKCRDTLPVTTGKLLERHKRYDHIRVECREADERFKIELGKDGEA